MPLSYWCFLFPNWVLGSQKGCLSFSLWHLFAVFWKKICFSVHSFPHSFIYEDDILCYISHRTDFSRLLSWLNSIDSWTKITFEDQNAITFYLIPWFLSTKISSQGISSENLSQPLVFFMLFFNYSLQIKIYAFFIFIQFYAFDSFYLSKEKIWRSFLSMLDLG